MAVKTGLTVLNEEVNLLQRILYKNKHQHGNSLLYKTAKQIKSECSKLLLCYKDSKAEKIKEITKRGFVIFSSNLDQWHFPAFSLALMGISARIYFLIETRSKMIEPSKNKRVKKMAKKAANDNYDVIDQIFDD